MMKMLILKNDGQSLIELLSALAVVMIVVIALVAAVTTAMNASNFAKLKVQASGYSQEGMENLRRYRDSGWEVFSSKVGVSNGNTSTYGLASLTPSGSCPSTANVGDFFIRCVVFERAETNKIRITVTTSWTDSKGSHQSVLASYFTKW